jgi:hypothetical protein
VSFLTLPSAYHLCSRDSGLSMVVCSQAAVIYDPTSDH